MESVDDALFPLSTSFVVASFLRSTFYSRCCDPQCLRRDGARDMVHCYAPLVQSSVCCSLHGWKLPTSPVCHECVVGEGEGMLERDVSCINAYLYM